MYYIELFRYNKINFAASIVFGWDTDTKESIINTLDSIIRNKIEILIPWILTPFPGTKLFETLKNEGRLIHENYSLYDAWHVVFKPKNMSPFELKKQYWKVLNKFYSFKKCISRFLNERDKLTSLGFNFYYRSLVKKGLHPLTGFI